MSLSTHVLDLGLGRPAGGIAVQLDRRTADGGWEPLASHVTDADGRVQDLLGGRSAAAGVLRLTFATGAYLAARGTQAFFPEANIVFEIRDPAAHHHVPLLLSPFGWSTYRGS